MYFVSFVRHSTFPFGQVSPFVTSLLSRFIALALRVCCSPALLNGECYLLSVWGLLSNRPVAEKTAEMARASSSMLF